MRQYDLAPLYRSTVGFDRLFSLIDQMSGVDATAQSYPPYNIERTGENAYRISVAVAGFSDKDLTIETRENTLLDPGIEECAEGDATKLRGSLPGDRGSGLRAPVPARRSRSGDGRGPGTRAAPRRPRARDPGSPEAAPDPDRNAQRCSEDRRSQGGAQAGRLIPNVQPDRRAPLTRRPSCLSRKASAPLSPAGAAGTSPGLAGRGSRGRRRRGRRASDRAGHDTRLCAVRGGARICRGRVMGRAVSVAARNGQRIRHPGARGALAGALALDGLCWRARWRLRAQRHRSAPRARAEPRSALHCSAMARSAGPPDRSGDLPSWPELRPAGSRSGRVRSREAAADRSAWHGERRDWAAAPRHPAAAPHRGFARPCAGGLHGLWHGARPHRLDRRRPDCRRPRFRHPGCCRRGCRNPDCRRSECMSAASGRPGRRAP